MGIKRKRECGTLFGDTISSNHDIQIHKVDLNTALQNSDSSNPSTSLNTLLPWPVHTTESLSSSESSTASSQRFPLTKHNLHQLNRINRTMASNPNTPDNKSRKSKTTSTVTSDTVRSVRKALAQNNIYIDDSGAEARGADLIENARAIIKGERESALKKEKGLALREIAKKYANSNELTFLAHVWMKFWGDGPTRLVKSTVDGELEDEAEVIRWIETAWEKDYLRCNWNADFTRGSVPPLRILDPILAGAAEHAPKVKNPKPDLTYGLEEDAFSNDEQRINDRKGAGLLIDMVHPFFLVEAKSAERPIDEAENQCARGGAAMVRLKRKFDELAEGTFKDHESQQEKDKDGYNQAKQTSQNKEKTPIDDYRTDTKSFTFSLAIVPRNARMFVHWAEDAYSKEEVLLTTNWHANELHTYNLKFPEPWIELHRDMDNVLDWGTLTRKKELKELCHKILEREQSNKKQKT